MVQYAERLRRRKYRPWIAVVRYRLRHATWKEWFVLLGLMTALPLMTFLPDLREAVTSTEAPKWVEMVWRGAAWGVVVVGLFAADRWRAKVFKGVAPDLTNPWIPVHMTSEGGANVESSDNGSVCTEHGRLLFTGEHVSFQLGLDELEIIGSPSSGNRLELLVKATGQKIRLELVSHHRYANWRLFIEEVRAGGSPGYAPSVYPRKSPNQIVAEGYIAFAMLLIFGKLVGVAAWELSGVMPFNRHIAYFALFLVFVAMSAGVVLWLNLRLWQSVQRRMHLAQA